MATVPIQRTSLIVTSPSGKMPRTAAPRVICSNVAMRLSRGGARRGVWLVFGYLSSIDTLIRGATTYQKRRKGRALPLSRLVENAIGTSFPGQARGISCRRFQNRLGRQDNGRKSRKTGFT
jgi:hypothetical protein